MTDKEFVERCRELHKQGVPWLAARFYLWEENAGSYKEIEQRIVRLDPFCVRGGGAEVGK